jgi:uncharacterized protein YndB with AHSA1/START domain
MNLRSAVFLPIAALTLTAGAPDTAPMVVEALLDAPVAEVWKVFSTPEGFKALGVAKCDMDFRIGGLIRSCYSEASTLGDPSTIQNRILAFEPERMLAFRIDRPPKDFPFPQAWASVWSVATFTDAGGGRTLLRLAQMGYTGEEESRKMRAFFEAGNAWTLKKLQKHFNPSVQVAPPSEAHGPK